MEKKYIFDNENNFINDIKTIDITAPLKSQGRKTEHAERYSIVLLLKFLYKQKYLDYPYYPYYPFVLLHQDRPDFKISFNNKNIGIEHTQAIPEQLAKALAILDKCFPDTAIIEPEFFNWDSPRRSKKEIKKIITESQIALHGNGYYGKSAEFSWIKRIKNCIEHKTKKLNNPQFKKYDKNWLLIYDNQSSPSLDKKDVSEKLKEFLFHYFKTKTKIKFDKTFVLYGNEGIFVLDYKILPQIEFFQGDFFILI